MSLKMVIVVASTNTENRNVQIGSAILYSGCVDNNEKTNKKTLSTFMVEITLSKENYIISVFHRISTHTVPLYCTRLPSAINRKMNENIW